MESTYSSLNMIVKEEPVDDSAEVELNEEISGNTLENLNSVETEHMEEDAGVGENNDDDNDPLKRELEIANYRLNLVEGEKERALSNMKKLNHTLQEFKKNAMEKDNLLSVEKNKNKELSAKIDVLNIKLAACEQSIQNLNEQDGLMISSNVNIEDRLKRENEELQSKLEDSEKLSMNAIETLRSRLKREQDSSNTFRLSLKKKDDTIRQLTTQLKVCKPSDSSSSFIESSPSTINNSSLTIDVFPPSIESSPSFMDQSVSFIKKSPQPQPLQIPQPLLIQQELQPATTFSNLHEAIAQSALKEIVHSFSSEVLLRSTLSDLLIKQ